LHEAVGGSGRLHRAEKSTLAGTFLGWMLDGMDVMLFSFVMPTLIAIWGISQGEAGLLGTTTLLFSAFGGWLAGLAADRWGRVHVLQVTILWFSLFTFLSGFTSSFEQLMVTRSLQGLGFGGEWAVGSVLIAETIRAEHRGKAVGFVQSGWAIGWGLAALFYTVLFSTFADEIAWRIMFWIGILPALLVFFIRRHVPESAVFVRSGRLQQAGRAKGGSLHIDFTETPRMEGPLEHWQYDTFVTRFTDTTIEPAYVTFSLDPHGKVERVTMKAVSPVADFSFDYHHLLFEPARNER